MARLWFLSAALADAQAARAWYEAQSEGLGDDFAEFREISSMRA